ncbi:MAG: 3-dehydroquinate dehydratase-2 [Flavobacteriales bacterium]
MNKRIAIINGPNLNLLGKREPEVYGDQSFESVLEQAKGRFPEVELVYYQSNVEGEIINFLHQEGFSAVGIVINPGGYTHTSVAIRDAISSIDAPVVEVHISNLYQREDFRRISLTAAVCKAIISGIGTVGYFAAIEALLQSE